MEHGDTTTGRLLRCALDKLVDAHFLIQERLIVQFAGLADLDR